MTTLDTIRVAAFAAAVLAAPGVVGAQANPSRGIAIERKLANELGLGLGQTVRLTKAPADSGSDFVVQAIYTGRPDPATVLRGEYRARLHLSDLAGMLGHPDRVDRIGVVAAPGITPDSLAAAINRGALGYRAFPSAAIASESSRTFIVISRFHRAIGFIAILASAIFLLCIMLLKVEERRQDAAVLRMIGMSRRTLFQAFVLEACIIATLGAALGTVFAYLGSLAINGFYQRRFETSLVFSFLTADVIALGVALSLALGIGAGALAAQRLLAVDPLTLWRRRA